MQQNFECKLYILVDLCNIKVMTIKFCCAILSKHKVWHTSKFSTEYIYIIYFIPREERRKPATLSF